MPGHSSFSFSASSLSRSSGGMVTAKRDEMEPPPDGLVDRSKRRLMVAGDDQFECGPILEEVLAHEAGRNGVAAGELLDPEFGPATAFFGFGRGDEAGAAEAGEVGRMAIAVARREGLDRGRLVIVAKYPSDC